MLEKISKIAAVLVSVALVIMVDSCSKKNQQGYRENINGKDGSVLVAIPSGDFIMGGDDCGPSEKPIHKVYLAKYSIGKYEVTVGQYRKFCKATGKTMAKQPTWNTRDDHPVVNVSWKDAKAYCDWAGLRLPTEAEWEKAARGTDGRKYPWGDDLSRGDCNSAGGSDGYEETAPVGSFTTSASPYGCLDMIGNVWEWCNDWYGEYDSKQSKDPKGPTSGERRIARGGSAINDYFYCRTYFREADEPSFHDNYTGFRVAK